MPRYELVERIGLGGMAEIFRGKATAAGGFEKLVAIKRILPHLSQDKRFVELLITEAKTLSRLRHRNIVQIHDVGHGDDGQYFLVMEFVDGIDLGALYEALEKRGRRLPLGVSLYIVSEVCDALDHAHRARSAEGQPLRLVHRDVSPSNVLLSRAGEVKLTDFGIAKRNEEATGHGGVRGKFAYISPEQAHNRHVDPRSDVYSLGIVLYELVTGKRLFSSLPDFDALKAAREGRNPRPRDVDPGIAPDLDRILVAALAPRPEDRFATAAAFAAELRAHRYALVDTGADPAVEVARLVEDHAARPVRLSHLSREPSVVRINTVVGWPGIELSEETTGGGFTGELTISAAPRHLRIDDEDTHNARLPEAELGARDGDRAPEPVTAQVGAIPSVADLDVSEAETSVLDFRLTRALIDLGPESVSPTADVAGSPPSEPALVDATVPDAALIELDADGGPHAGSSSYAAARDTTFRQPTWIQQLFKGGPPAAAEGGSRSRFGRLRELWRAMSSPRRRAILIAAASLLGIALGAGVVLLLHGDTDTESSAAVLPDAGPTPAAQARAPAEAAESAAKGASTPSRRRPKKKAPPKKKPSKTQSGKTQPDKRKRTDHR